MANCFTKYSLKKVPVLLSHKKCFGSKFAFTKTLWSRSAEYVVAFLKKTVLLCFLLYSHFLCQTLLIFHLRARLSGSKPFFFSCGPLKCPLVEVKELCGMFPNSFNGFQVFWATSQTASTPYQHRAHCVLCDRTPCSAFKAVYCFFFSKSHSGSFALLRFNFPKIVVFLKNSYIYAYFPLKPY